MNIKDCHGRARMAAFDRAKREFRGLALAANRAADGVCEEVRIYEHPGCFVGGRPEPEWWAAHACVFAAETADALEAVQRAKRGLLDTLAYIDGLDLAPYPSASVQDVSAAAFDHRRAVFFSNALNACDALSGKQFEADIFARTLAAADDLAQAIRRAGEQYKQYIPKE